MFPNKLVQLLVVRGQAVGCSLLDLTLDPGTL